MDKPLHFGALILQFIFVAVNLSLVITEKYEKGGFGDSTGGVCGAFKSGAAESIGEIDLEIRREQRASIAWRGNLSILFLVCRWIVIFN